jgi:hypothetical protein
MFKEVLNTLVFLLPYQILKTPNLLMPSAAPGTYLHQKLRLSTLQFRLYFCLYINLYHCTLQATDKYSLAKNEEQMFMTDELKIPKTYFVCNTNAIEMHILRSILYLTSTPWQFLDIGFRLRLTFSVYI